MCYQTIRRMYSISYFIYHGFSLMMFWKVEACALCPYLQLHCCHDGGCEADQAHARPHAVQLAPFLYHIFCPGIIVRRVQKSWFHIHQLVVGFLDTQLGVRPQRSDACERHLPKRFCRGINCSTHERIQEHPEWPHKRSRGWENMLPVGQTISARIFLSRWDLDCGHVKCKARSQPNPEERSGLQIFADGIFA